MVINLVNNFNCGKRIKELRKLHSISQERLALNAGITTAYLGLLERDKRNPTVHTIEHICNALNISLSEFFSPAENENKSISVNDQINSQLLGMDDEEKAAVLQLIKQLVHIRELGVEKAENKYKKQHPHYE